MKRFEKYMKWIMAFVFGVALIVVYKTFDNMHNVMAFFGTVIGALTPFIIGAVIAYIFNLPCKKIENLYVRAKPLKKHSRALSVATVYIIFILIITVAISTILPRLYYNIIDLYNNIIPFSQNALAYIDGLQKKLGITIFEINEANARDAVQGILNSINVKEFGKYAQGAISFTSGLLDVFIAMIVSIYLLIDRDTIYKCCKETAVVIIPEDKLLKIRRYLSKINEICSNYIYCCVLDAFIVAILATVILSLIGVKYSIIFGTLIGLCNLIPYFGAMISNVVTVVITIFTGGWFKAVWSAVALLVLGQIDGNIIGPKIMGNKLEVSPLLIIFAVTLGGGLFGILGMLLSVPAMMVIKMILTELIESIKEKRILESKERSEADG